MLIASSMAALSFQKGLGAVHSLAHQLSTRSAILHVVANAILLPYVMEFNLPAIVDSYAEMASALGVGTSDMTKDEAADAAIDEVRSLKKELGMPAGLMAAGVEWECIPELAKDAMLDHCHRCNPRPCTEKNMRQLFEAAF